MHTASIRRLFVGTALALSTLAALAHSYKAGSIDIDHPTARPTAAGQAVAGGFMTFVNKGTADRLLSATTPVAASVQIHSMAMDGNVMKMRQLEALELPTGQVVELKPGSWHLMLMGLKAPLKAGDKFPMTLRFEKTGETVVSVQVEQPQPEAAKVESKHHHQH
jgi:copper(I)-binding protein